MPPGRLGPLTRIGLVPSPLFKTNYPQSFASLSFSYKLPTIRCSCSCKLPTILCSRFPLCQFTYSPLHWWGQITPDPLSCSHQLPTVLCTRLSALLRSSLVGLQCYPGHLGPVPHPVPCPPRGCSAVLYAWVPFPIPISLPPRTPGSLEEKVLRVE